MWGGISESNLSNYYYNSDLFLTYSDIVVKIEAGRIEHSALHTKYSCLHMAQYTKCF